MRYLGTRNCEIIDADKEKVESLLVSLALNLSEVAILSASNGAGR